MPDVSPSAAAPDCQTWLVPMRDSVGLATDVYLPDGPGPWPVLIERTPYDRRGISGSEVAVGRNQPLTRIEVASWFRARGFAVVMQDVRGRHGSQGRFEKYINEAEDGFDTLSWITRQDWCDGRICTMGLSYGAHTQLAAACAGAPGLAAMCIDTGGLFDVFDHSLRYGGAFELKQLTWALRHARIDAAKRGDDAAVAALDHLDVAASLSSGRWQRGTSPLAVVPKYEDMLFDLWETETPSPRWQGPATCARRWLQHLPDVPICLIGSWNDPYANSMLALQAALARQQTAPLRLVMGPWLHGRRSQSWAGEAQFGAASTLDALTGQSFLQLREAWFRFALGQGADPFAGRNALFEMGGGLAETDLPDGALDVGGHWHRAEAETQLPATAQTMAFAAAAPHLLRPTDGGDAPPAGFTLPVDPKQPVPTLGGAITSGAPVMQGGMFRLAPSGSGLSALDRGDVLILQSAPLDQPLRICGSPLLQFVGHADTDGFDLSATLLDGDGDWQDPQTRLFNVTDGIRRQSPGHAPTGCVQMMATAYHFARGHRITLMLAGSNFPRFDLNPSYGSRMPQPPGSPDARIDISLSGLQLQLPILPS